MGLHLERGRRRAVALAAAAIAAAAQLAAGAWEGLALPVNLAVAAGLAALLYLAFGVRVTLRRGWGVLMTILALAGFSALILQLPMFEWIGPIVAKYNRYRHVWYRWLHFLPQGWLKSVAVGFVMLALLFTLTASAKWAGLIWVGFCWVFGMIDAAVYEFSGNVITVSDITAIDTALNVAGNYRLEIVPPMIPQLLLAIACFAALIRCREERPRLARLRVRLAALVCAAAGAFYLAGAVRRGRSSTFAFNGVRRNGIFTSFLIELKTLNVRAPEGYSAEAAAALGEKYPARAATVADEDRPHVIAIMVEAFSDLAVLGDFDTDIEYMPFTRDLMKQSVSGQALVSTLGGGTARSEWEFLTGNTMGFMPGGSMPFRQFMGDDENSIVKVYKNAGYHTIGMHPFHGNGWGRNRVYPAVGFDDIIFLEDSEWDDYVRKFVSDRGFVHKVIDLFEHRDYDAPMFFFGVTMQNHSDYNDPDYPASVHLRGFEGSYPLAEQYLSLIRETDDAIRELIEYFSAVDEPVQIVFFGDHQPRLNGGFYREVGQRFAMQKYVVPFVMWDNYAHRVEEVPVTSVNFLGARLIDLTGVQKPAWYAFLSALSETVPAMDHVGFYAGGAFHDYDDEDADVDPDVLALLDEYRIYQYANMFDKDADRALFIGAAD